MSGRGRGRGGFGRGAGGAPQIKDEDGQYVTRDVTGPPPLYPEIDLPAREDPSEEATQLKDKWRALTNYWKSSPYHLKLVERKSGTKRSLQDFLGDGVSKDRLETGQLAKVLTLHPKYFPEELYTSYEERVSSKASSSAAQKQYWAAMNKSLKDSSGAAFDRLAKMEAQREDNAEAANPGETVIKTEEAEKQEEEGEENEADEDGPDEDDYEDDEYLQTAYNDDDEGYEDDFGDDGDDGGAAYY